MATVTVSTVRAATTEKGMIQVIAATRMGKDKKEVPADQKLRAIIIPEWQPNVSSKYTSIVVQALAETAKAQLAAQWEQNPQIKEVDSNLYTEDALLLFAAREAESKKLSAANILAWWDQSALKMNFTATYTEAQVKRFASELENIAAPVPNYNEEKALKRIATLGKFESDIEHETCQQMIRKLNAVVERFQKMREEIGSIEEIDA